MGVGMDTGWEALLNSSGVCSSDPSELMKSTFYGLLREQCVGEGPGHSKGLSSVWDPAPPAHSVIAGLGFCCLTTPLPPLPLQENPGWHRAYLGLQL